MKSKKKNSKEKKEEKGSVIHLRLDYEEAVSSKRDILSAEISILNALRTAKRYHLLRDEELKTKIKTYNKLNTLTAEIRKLHKILPKIQLPKILSKKETPEEIIIEPKEEEKVKPEFKKTENDLEQNLREIQEKLNSLSQYK